MSTWAATRSAGPRAAARRAGREEDERSADRYPVGAGPLRRDVRHVRYGVAESKKALQVILEDADLIELARILMDDDAEGALAFLKTHLKGKAMDLLEGG
jgi:hypothetical protein